MMNYSDKTIREYLENSRENFDLAGVAAGIKVDDTSSMAAAGLDVEYAFGYSDFEEKIPLHTDNVFHLASVSKLFVSTAIMQLASKGVLNVDDKLADILPDFKMVDEQYKEITIAQLLSHTAGMHDVSDYHWETPRTDADALRSYVYSEEVLEGRLLHRPGEKSFIYSNIGYEILGHIISVCSNMDFEKYIAENIFIPLAMRDSTFLTFMRKAEKNRLASPHIKDENKHIRKIEIYPYNREHGPSSTLTSTLKDIKKWGDAHLNNYFMDLPYDKIWNPLVEVPITGELMGLGWFIREQEGYTLYGHEGSDDGFRSSFWICPELKTQITVLSNLDKAPVKRINRRLFELLVK